MKPFIATFVDSLRSPAFYRRVSEEGKFSRALGHFALFVLLVSIIASIAPIVRYGQMLSDTEKIGMARSAVLDTYPDELELRIADGIASSNVEEPYLVPFPESWDIQVTGDMRALALIRTEEPLSIDAFREYGVPVVVGRTEIGFMEEDGGIRVRSFDEFSDAGEIVINESVIAGLLDTVIPILRPVAWGLLLSLPFLFFGSLFIGYLLYLLFGALLVLVVANIRGASYGYAQAYRASLYLIAVPMVYGVITSVWFFPEYRIPFLVSILLVVMAAGLIRKSKAGEDVDTDTAAERQLLPSVPEVTEMKEESKAQ